MEVQNVGNEPATFRCVMEAEIVGADVPPDTRSDLPLTEALRDHNQRREAAAVMLYQNLEEGTPVRLVRGKLDGTRPPYLVLETAFPNLPLRYRIELLVIGAETVSEADLEL